MPDISQIVPLAKVLEVSTDKLLGYTDAAYEKELGKIKNQLTGINLIDDIDRAEKLYHSTSQFFDKYPDMPEVALACLESYVVLFSKKRINVSNEVFLKECDRYSNSVFHNEKPAICVRG